MGHKHLHQCSLFCRPSSLSLGINEYVGDEVRKGKPQSLYFYLLESLGENEKLSSSRINTTEKTKQVLETNHPLTKSTVYLQDLDVEVKLPDTVTDSQQPSVESDKNLPKKMSDYLSNTEFDQHDQDIAFEQQIDETKDDQHSNTTPEEQHSTECHASPEENLPLNDSAIHSDDDKESKSTIVFGTKSKLSQVVELLVTKYLPNNVRNQFILLKKIEGGKGWKILQPNTTVIVGGHKFHLHRQVLQRDSKYFADRISNRKNAQCVFHVSFIRITA